MAEEIVPTKGASEAYAANTALRASVNLIPYIGGALDMVLSSKGQAAVQRRIQSLLADLAAEMSAMQETAVKMDYLGSEEFFDLLLHAFEASARTRQDEKIALYARIVSGAVISEEDATLDAEDYLNILAELSPRELSVALAIYEMQKEPPVADKPLSNVTNQDSDELAKSCPGIAKDDLPFICLRLQRSGLIREVSGAFYGYAGGAYVVTETFRKLMRFVQTST